MSDWIGGLLLGSVFLNDRDHRVFHDVAAKPAKPGQIPAPVAILGFEESEANSRVSDRPLLESLGRFPVAALPEHRAQKVLVLRDPYNAWASRVTANATRVKAGRPGLTSDPSWELYRENWRQLAGLAPDPESLAIGWRLSTRGVRSG